MTETKKKIINKCIKDLERRIAKLTEKIDAKPWVDFMRYQEQADALFLKMQKEKSYTTANLKLCKELNEKSDSYLKKTNLNNKYLLTWLRKRGDLKIELEQFKAEKQSLFW